MCQVRESPAPLDLLGEQLHLNDTGERTGGHVQDQHALHELGLGDLWSVVWIVKGWWRCSNGLLPGIALALKHLLSGLAQTCHAKAGSFLTGQLACPADVSTALDRARAP